jgi:transcriptional regulator with GAF, ATPase, and Fis domain/tetratricopeptide (TPR) repeat protein
MLSRDRHDPPEPTGRPPATTLEALEEVGDFHRSSDGYGTALEYYEAAIRSLGVDQEFDPTVAARLNRKIASCYRSRGLLDQAFLYLERARQFLKGYEFELEFGSVLSARAEILLDNGKPDAALRDCSLAIEILRSSAAHREFALVQRVAARCHAQLGNQAEYEQLNLDALATYRRINDQEGIANVYNNLGIAYKKQCKWDQAIRALTKAKEIGEKIGLTRRLARTFNNLGIVYTKTREFDEAISHLRRARRLAQALGDYSTLVSVLNSMGRALNEAGRYRQAEKYLLEARVLAEKHHFARSQALADEFLGDLMLYQDRFDAARENYESGLRKARAIAPRGDVVGEIQRRIAELELRSGLRSQAIATARRALKICLGCGETHEIGFIHRTIGEAYMGLGQPRKAVQALEDSVAAFDETQNPHATAWSRTLLAQAWLEKSGREALLRAQKEAQAATEIFRRLEDDRGYTHAGLVLAQAHRLAGNHDEGLLVLYDIERLCEDNPEFELLAQARTLRKEFECALVSTAAGESSQLNLFGELYTLANPGGGTIEEKLRGVIQSLCIRAKASAAFVSLTLPGGATPLVKSTYGIETNEALVLSEWICAQASAPMVLSQVDGSLAQRFPKLAERAGAIICQPLTFEDRALGILYLERPRSDGPDAFTQNQVDFVATYANLAGVVLYELFRDDFQEVSPVNTGASVHPALARVITNNASMFHVLGLVEKVAASTCTVLFSGETGSGKGLLAHCLHQMSDRRNKKFIALNCAAMPEQLLESELFGHVRGAFTSADSSKVGLFEAAHGGTVFLDEVGRTSLFMQGKLLQFLDSSQVRPVGSNEFRSVDVRVICASKIDLRKQVENGQFLEDLYYRLNDFPIAIPALRERGEDVRLLMEYCLRKHSAELDKKVTGFSRQAVQIMQQYNWPGNVRELEKCVKRAVILADDEGTITVRHLRDEVKVPERHARATLLRDGLSLRDHLARVEAELIRDSMKKAAGNKSEAARMLGISYPNLLQKIKLYGADAFTEKP